MGLTRLPSFCFFCLLIVSYLLDLQIFRTMIFSLFMDRFVMLSHCMPFSSIHFDFLFSCLRLFVSLIWYDSTTTIPVCFVARPGVQAPLAAQQHDRHELTRARRESQGPNLSASLLPRAFTIRANASGFSPSFLFFYCYCCGASPFPSLVSVSSLFFSLFCFSGSSWFLFAGRHKRAESWSPSFKQ